MMNLHPNARVNFCLLMGLGAWTVLFWPIALLLFSTFLHTPAGVIEALLTYTLTIVGGPVVANLLSIGKRKDKDHAVSPLSILSRDSDRPSGGDAGAGSA